METKQTSVARRRFNKCISRLKLTTCFCIFHHTTTNAIFNATASIEKFTLGHFNTTYTQQTEHCSSSSLHPLHTLSYRCLIGLSFGSNPLLMLYIHNQFHADTFDVGIQQCRMLTIICIVDYDRSAHMTLATLRLPICFVQLVLSQWPGRQ